MNTQATTEIIERTAQIGSWEWNIDLDAWSFSSGWCKLHGVTPDEAHSDHNLWTLVYPADASILKNALSGAMAGIQPHDVTIRIVRRTDGAVRWMRAQGELVLSAGGRPVKLVGVTQDITERKEQEAAFRQQDSLLAAVLECSAERIWAVDMGYCLLMANSTMRWEMRRTYGRELAIGENTLATPIPEHVREEWRHLYDRALQGQSFTVEIRLSSGDRWMEYSYRPIADAGGQIGGVVVSGHDITERKRLEQERLSQLQRFTALIENTEDRIWAVDTEYRLIVANRPFQRGFQVAFGRELAPGECVLISEAPETVNQRWQAHFDRAFRGEQFSIETQTQFASESSFREYQFNPIRAADGQVSGVVISGRDTTARRQAEEALRVNLTKYATLFSSAPMGITVTDDQGKILETNAAAERILGVAKTEHEQRTYDGPEWQIVRPDGSPMPPGEYASVRALHEQRLVENIESGIVKAPEQVTWISVNAAPIPLPGYGVVVTYSDISQRQEIEQALHLLNDELELRVSQRTAELHTALTELQHAEELKDAFLAAVSHELRTPLMGILGMADALEWQFNTTLSERQRHYVQQIHQSGGRLLKMVDSILHYTALVAGRVPLRVEPCRLLELGTSCMRTIAAHAESKGIQQKFTVEPYDVEILSDGSSILQVLGNLLDNAVKFTPEGGAIGLAISDDADRECVRLTVWDTGIGIAAEQVEAIFKPFEQLDHGLSRRYEGVGLGLAYVEQMVNLLGGTIAVESELGKGSRFTVTLPNTPDTKPSRF